MPCQRASKMPRKALHVSLPRLSTLCVWLRLSASLPWEDRFPTHRNLLPAHPELPDVPPGWSPLEYRAQPGETQEPAVLSSGAPHSPLAQPLLPAAPGFVSPPRGAHGSTTSMGDTTARTKQHRRQARHVQQGTVSHLQKNDHRIIESMV